MGHGLQHVLGIQRLAYFGGVVFAVIIILQYFEFPYGDVISSLFSDSKIHITYGGANSDRRYISISNATAALTAPQNLLDSDKSKTYKNASNSVHNFTKNGSSTGDVFPSANLSVVAEVRRKKEKKQIVKVVSIYEMRDILVHNRASSHSMVWEILNWFLRNYM